MIVLLMRVIVVLTDVLDRGYISYLWSLAFKVEFSF